MLRNPSFFCIFPDECSYIFEFSEYVEEQRSKVRLQYVCYNLNIQINMTVN